MTEDDTFRVLQRASFEDMAAEFDRISAAWRQAWRDDPMDAILWQNETVHAAHRHGWTLTDWTDENIRRRRAEKGY